MTDAVKLARETIAAAACCNSVPLARAVLDQEAELTKLRAALKEALDVIAGTTQCESQYPDFHDDPDWRLQERLRRLV